MQRTRTDRRSNGADDVSAAPLSTTQLYVGLLPQDYDVGRMEADFKVFGTLTDFFISHRRNRHRGFGFVTYANPADATQAVESMNGSQIQGSDKRMKVMFARQRPSRRNDRRSDDSARSRGGPPGRRPGRQGERAARPQRGSDSRRPPQGQPREAKQIRPPQKAAAAPSPAAAAAPASAASAAAAAAAAPAAAPAAPATRKSPYLQLKEWFEKKNQILQSNKDSFAEIAAVNKFVIACDSEMRDLLNQLKATFGSVPAPILEFIDSSFRSFGWVWHQTDGRQSTIVGGSQPPNVDILIDWTAQGTQHFAQRFQAKAKRPAASA